MEVDIRKIAEALLSQLDTDHAARKEGVILLHNTIMAEIERLKAPAPVAPAQVDAEITTGVPVV